MPIRTLKQMCDVFNKYCAVVGSEIAQNFTMQSTSNFLNFMRSDYTKSFFLSTVKPEEFLNAIETLKKLLFTYSYSCPSTKKYI